MQQWVGLITRVLISLVALPFIDENMEQVSSPLRPLCLIIYVRIIFFFWGPGVGGVSLIMGASITYHTSRKICLRDRNLRKHLLGQLLNQVRDF